MAAGLLAVQALACLGWGMARSSLISACCHCFACRVLRVLSIGSRRAAPAAANATRKPAELRLKCCPPLLPLCFPCLHLSLSPPAEDYGQVRSYSVDLSPSRPFLGMPKGGSWALYGWQNDTGGLHE